MTYIPYKAAKKAKVKEREMTVNGLTMTMHTPRVLKPRIVNGKEVSQGLPPACSITPYVVDEYPACPEDWMHGSDKASSYFVAVKDNRGLWFDFNDCSDHEHDVAVVLSIQGVNPITGQKQDKMRLEKYESKCPIHKCDFKQDRFCPECEYKWPSQNYISTTDTPHGLFWLDGFRSEDGKVRQYVLTEEKMKGIAQQVLGDKEAVYAIGVAFYLSKDAKPKPEPRDEPTRGSIFPQSLGKPTEWVQISQPDVIWKSAITADNADDSVKISTTNDTNYSSENLTVLEGADAIRKRPSMYGFTDGQTKSMSDSELESAVHQKLSQTMGMASSQPVDDLEVVSRRGAVPEQILRSKKPNKIKQANIARAKIEKKLEVGAGSLIGQQIYRDSKSIDYWRDEPEGFIYINYCPEEEIDKILKAGKREEKKDGFLTGLNRSDV